MGTMLITRSTPRITYKIGMRARVGAAADKSLPWLTWEAPSIEVAADFTGIYRILMCEAVRQGENREIRHYQSTNQTERGVRSGKKTHLRKPATEHNLRPQLSLLPRRVISS